MDLDLNQEPVDQTHASTDAFNSLLEELESAHEHVQDRIRHIEMITSRVRQRQRWPPAHNPIRITNFTGQAGTPADAHDEGTVHREVEERVVENGKGCKRKGAHLIAEALGTEPELAYVYANARECPVCKGEVTETDLTPVYGNASASGNLELGLKGAGLRVPPRPVAPRIESFRQQLISQGASSSVIQSIRRFNNLIGVLGVPVQSQSPNAATDRNNVLLTQSRLQAGNDRSAGSSPISNLLVQGAASFSSLSSALNSAMDSAERLVEDLESYIHDHQVGGSVQLNNGNVARTDSTAAASTPPSSRNVEPTVGIGSEIQTTDSTIQTETSPLDPSSQSGSTRGSTSRRASNDRRRRRLRFQMIAEEEG